MRIRERTDADLSQLIDLARSVHRSDGYPPYLPDADVERFLTPAGQLTAWVGVMDGNIVGHVSLHADSSPDVIELAEVLGDQPIGFGVVARLLVGGRHRRSGAGRRLLDHATNACRRRGLTPILDVVDRFSAAISLYESAGWIRLGTVEVRLPDGSTVREHVYAAPIDENDPPPSVAI